MIIESFAEHIDNNNKHDLPGLRWRFSDLDRCAIIYYKKIMKNLPKHPPTSGLHPSYLHYLRVVLQTIFGNGVLEKHHSKIRHNLLEIKNFFLLPNIV